MLKRSIELRGAAESSDNSLGARHYDTLHMRIVI